MNELTYRVYAAVGTDLDAEARRLTDQLGSGECHQSEYMGGDYYVWRVPAGEVRLLPNSQGPEDDEFFNADHPEVVLVVDVSVHGDDPIEPLADVLGYVRLT